MLVQRGTSRLAGVRMRLYESGAVKTSAETIEASRKRIHAAVAGLGNPHPALRTWLPLINSLAGLIYEPPPLPESSALLQPNGPWRDAASDLAKEFARDLAALAPPSQPPLLPSGLPQCLYDPGRRIVLYPDLDGKAGEVLPLVAAFIGAKNLDEEQSLETLAANLRAPAAAGSALRARAEPAPVSVDGLFIRTVGISNAVQSHAALGHQTGHDHLHITGAHPSKIHATRLRDIDAVVRSQGESFRLCDVEVRE
ncbi:hypothetical protein ACVIYL_004828 [Bradyrhizobium sp. USDA 3315]